MTDESSDGIRERSDWSTAVVYLLLDADRRLVAAGVLSSVFVGLVASAYVVPGGLAALHTGDPVETAFQAFIGATVTGVTIVLTLNQLVLSQELGAVGDQRDRMDGAMTFRDDVGDLLGSTPPAEPSAFLSALLDETADRARTVRERADLDGVDDDLDRLLDNTIANADSVAERLEGTSFGEFEVVRTALDFNYSWKLYAARRALEDESLTEETRDALEPLVEALEFFGPAREHFKTLYIQAELIDLSRLVTYAAVPSLVVSVATLFYFDVATFGGTVLGVETAVLLVSASVAIAIAPFAVLLAYVLRVATVTGRTLSIGPFILRETDRETDA